MRIKPTSTVIVSRTALEFEEIIKGIIQVLCDEAATVTKEIDEWRRKEESLAQLAKITELKIRKAEIKRIIKLVYPKMRQSTYRLILATIDPDLVNN